MYVFAPEAFSVVEPPAHIAGEAGSTIIVGIALIIACTGVRGPSHKVNAFLIDT
jgi:hypothetical protein